jgi:hypothetical protein
VVGVGVVVGVFVGVVVGVILGVGVIVAVGLGVGVVVGVILGVGVIVAVGLGVGDGDGGIGCETKTSGTKPPKLYIFSPLKYVSISFLNLAIVYQFNFIYEFIYIYLTFYLKIVGFYEVWVIIFTYVIEHHQTYD